MNHFDTGSFMSLISSVNGEIEFNPAMLVSTCYPDDRQPRYKNLTPEGVKDICATLKMKGGRIWQPILVHEKNDKGYKIITGHRRWLASKVEDLDTIPALIVKRGIDSKSFNLLIQLVENISRKNLDIREEGRTYKRLKEEFKLTGAEISASLDRSESFVSEAITMYEMEDTSALSFLNDVYEKDICRDTTTLVALIRLARVDAKGCKQLVDWAIEHNCLNRKWAKSLKEIDLTLPFEDKINALTRAFPLHSPSANETNAYPVKENEPDSSNALNGLNHEGLNTKPENKLSDRDDDLPYITRPISKAQIEVRYKESLANILLERVDKEVGYAWIKQVSKGAKPVRVLVEDLSILHLK